MDFYFFYFNYRVGVIENELTTGIKEFWIVYQIMMWYIPSY